MKYYTKRLTSTEIKYHCINKVKTEAVDQNTSYSH